MTYPRQTGGAISRAQHLTRLPVRLTFLRKGPWSLDGVLRVLHAQHFGVVQVEGDVERIAQTLQRCLLTGSHRQWGTFQNLIGPPENSGHEFGQWHHFIDDASAVRLLYRHVAPCQDMAHSNFVGDHARQAMHTTSACHQPDPYFGQSQPSVLSCDDDVAR